MDQLDQKKTITIIVAVVVIALFIGASFFIKRSPSPIPQAGTPAADEGPKTRSAPPQNVVVPEKNSANVPENVAKPQIVNPSSPTSQANFRSFDLGVDGDKFVPDTVIVRAGDTIRLNITAVDKNYDFTQPDFGFSAPLLKGQEKVIAFGATAAGKFTFFCKSCGGPDKGPVGYIIISQN